MKFWYFAECNDNRVSHFVFLAQSNWEYDSMTVLESRVGIRQCQRKCRCMFRQPKHFGAVASFVYALALVLTCFVRSYVKRRDSVISKQMFRNSYCSFFTSFSPLFMHIAQWFSSSHQFFLPKDISFTRLFPACRKN